MATSNGLKTVFAVSCALLSLTAMASQRKDDPPQFRIAPSIRINPNPSVPLAAIVDFETSKPVRASLLLNDGRSTELLYETDFLADVFSLPVFGLRPNTDHAVTVVIRDGLQNEVVWPEPLTIRTDALPEDFPLITTLISDPDRMEPGVTLFNLNQQGIGLIAAVNKWGEVVWFYRQTVDGIGDIRRLANGHLVFLDREGAVEIDMLGNVFQRWRPTNLRDIPSAVDVTPVDVDTFHHELYETRSNSFLTLSTEARAFHSYPTSETNSGADSRPAHVVGDVVVEFERDGRILRQFSMLDILDPYRIGFDSLAGIWNSTYSALVGGTRDWSHGNAVVEDPSDDSWILSLRHQDALVKLDKTTGQLIWILGTPDGWTSPWEHYLLKPEGNLKWPYHQHAPALTPKGSLLIFDNGNFRRRPTEPMTNESYSRVVEYAVDRARMTISELWSYGGPGDELFYSSALGDADWLPFTENVLVTDGFRITNDIPDSRWARIFEVTHTTPGKKVFEITIRDAPGSAYRGWRVYRADRLPSLYPPQVPE